MLRKKKHSYDSLLTADESVDFALVCRNKETAKLRRKYYFKNNFYIYLMIIPVVLWFCLFAYWPLTYLVIAFGEYHITDGTNIFLSEWWGFDNFVDFFTIYHGWDLIWNTLAINMLALVFLFPFPIILAILFNEVFNAVFKKSIQTITYLPHFLSTTALVGVIVTVFSNTGIINSIIISCGGSPENFLESSKWFRAIQVISGIWQTAGWSTIVYTAAISSINPQLYEAAKVDGSSRWRQIWHITLPGMKQTILLMLIMQLGSIMGSNFDKIYLQQNPGNLDVSEVVLTFIYKQGLGLGGGTTNLSLSTAVGLINSVVGLIFVVASNYLSKKTNETSIW